jgi:hypothetical protein
MSYRAASATRRILAPANAVPIERAITELNRVRHIVGARIVLLLD